MEINTKFRLYLYRLYYFSSDKKENIVIYFKLFGFGDIDESLRCLFGFHCFYDKENNDHYDELYNIIKEDCFYYYYNFSFCWFNYNFKTLISKTCRT